VSNKNFNSLYTKKNKQERNTHIEDQTLFSLHRSECQRFPIFWFVNQKKQKHTCIKLSKEIWINASHNQELSLPRSEWCSFPIFWIRNAFVRMSFILPLINPLQSQCQNERPVRWDRTLTESRKENMFLFESLSIFVRKFINFCSKVYKFLFESFSIFVRKFINFCSK
jgi:hypothetical protein